MQRFFESVLEPVFKLEGIKTIVEIGADRGYNTAKLIQYANKYNGKIYSIDPVPGFDSDTWEKENPESFIMIKDLSLNAIKDIKDADCFLIDGDHNWYTVYHELKMIYDTYGEEKFPLVLFHDILWPYDRRDLYYSPDNIPAIYCNDYEQKAMKPGSNELSEEGINGNHFNAKKYGGEKNGVLTAVEDFMRDYPSLELEFMAHDVLFGLGMIASAKRYPNAIKHFYSIDTLKGMMKVCESERLDKAVQIMTLIKKLNNYTKAEKKNQIAKFYPDFGEGYSEATAVTLGEYNAESGYYYGKVVFDKPPVSLRFDPVNDSYCVVDSLCVIASGDKLEPEKTNGTQVNSGYIFAIEDPQIIFKNKNNSREFKVSAYICPVKSIVALDMVKGLLSDKNMLLEDKKKLILDVEALNKDMNKLTSEKKMLTDDRNALAAKNEELTGEKNALTDKNEELEQKNKELAENNKKLVSDNDSISLANNKVVTERDNISADRDKKIKEISVLNGAINKLKVQLENVTNKSSALTEELKKTKKAVTDTKEVLSCDKRIAQKLIGLNKKIGWKFALKSLFTRGLFATRTNIKAIKEIRKNGGFDVLYYCAKYKDVLAKGIDPLLHFIWFGGYEGRNPSTEFESKKYLAKYNDVRKRKVNPFSHYVVYGKAENRNPCVSDNKKAEKSRAKYLENAVEQKAEVKDIKKNFETQKNKMNKESSVEIRDVRSTFSLKEFEYSKFSDKLKSLYQKTITIIVPVYNAYEETCECIESVLENTDFPYKLMLINDCSTDSRINDLMQKYSNHENIIVVNNEKNLGFVGTTNYGITHSENDVVFLNSDTKVTKGWLRKLVIAAYHKDNVATVTPFSNAAGAFSVPVIGENKNIPEGFVLDDMSSLVEHCSKLDYVHVPTGNGFCMYVTRAAIDAVGILDIEAFSKGYGEENDFCMRAKAKGFINIIADDTYIYHKRSASFKEEKQQLITNNRKILDERYPTYGNEIKIFSSSNELIANRSRIKDAVDNCNLINYRKKRILYVLHEGRGGTVKTNEDLMRFVEKDNMEVYMLNSNATQMKLYAFRNNGLDLLFVKNFEKKWGISDFYIPEYADFYFDVITNLHIDVIHIRHLFKHSFDIVNIADLLKIPVILSFHDFYFLCPTINLVNSEIKYCAADCRACDTNCPIYSGLINIDAPTNEWTQNIWRKEIKIILNKINSFVTTSDYTRELYLKIYPEIKDRFYVIEHGRDFDYNRTYRGKAPKRNKIVILLAGNIGVTKGSEYIKRLIKLDKKKILEFHCIGDMKDGIDPILDDNVIKHGKYVREDFARLVSEIKPAYIGIFSIWPETYCHVLTEGWSCGVPCIVSDVGTLRERAMLNGGCIRADLSDPEKTYHEILEVSFSDKYQTLCNEVQRADIHSINRMGTEYLALYHKVLYGSSEVLVWLNNFGEKKVASAHIRTISPVIKNPVVRKKVAVAELRNTSDIPFESNTISKLYIYIQRDKINSNSVDELVKRINNYCNVKVILEMDDDLLSVDEKHPEYKLYKDSAEKVKSIANISSKVISTNNTIIEHLGVDGIVIPNYLDESIWKFDSIKETLVEKQEYKILYFGTISHKNDLEIMRAPMEKLNIMLEKVNKKARLVVVGCTADKDTWYDVIQVPDEFKEYPYFIKWLQELGDFDIGVAPLELDNAINYAKSPLKYFEYSALGIPCVCTEIKPFSDIIKNNETAILVENNLADVWADMLYKLIVDSTFRKSLTERAREDVKKHHALSAHYKDIAELLLD